MKMLRIWKAQGGEAATITVGQTEIPEVNTLEEATKLYALDADSLELVLRLSLPEGTYDALLRRMLEKRASLLAIPIGGRQ